MTTQIDKEKHNVFSIENQKRLENHQIAIMQLKEAIKQHHEAVKKLNEENYYDGYICAIKANGHTEHALEIQNEILKAHVSDK